MGILSIAQEHLATEIIGNATRDLLRMVQPDINAKQILLAGMQGELHALPLYGAALHFTQWGYRAVIIGANTPPEALSHSVKSLQPDAVGLSITQKLSSSKADDILSQYAAACDGLPWIIGGAGTFAIRESITALGGMYVIGSPESIRETFETRIRESKS